MMLGFLLARSSIDVIVLEKHGDFFRDFRGDTIHPSTLEVLYEVGLLDGFLRLPHQELRRLTAQLADFSFEAADFSRLPTRCKFIALMPQWDFLNFLSDAARRYPTFTLYMNAGVNDLLRDGGRVTGVRANTPDGVLEIRCDLVIGADGRHSTVRQRAGLSVIDLGAPMDVLWFRLSRRLSDPETFGRIQPGRILAMINRESYWQCAYVIPKGKLAEVQQRGLAVFRGDVLAMVPFMQDRIDELHSWDDIKLLTVSVDRLRRWYAPGLLCIGDAAHAMSPIGGVGINLAIQDSVAAANILRSPLRNRDLTVKSLRKVQRRRQLPTRLTQAFQIFLQNRVIRAVLTGSAPVSLPLPLKLMNRWPVLRCIPAFVVGIGFRPEHVKQEPSRCHPEPVEGRAQH